MVFLFGNFQISFFTLHVYLDLVVAKKKNKTTELRVNEPWLRLVSDKDFGKWRNTSDCKWHVMVLVTPLPNDMTCY